MVDVHIKEQKKNGGVVVLRSQLCTGVEVNVPAGVVINHWVLMKLSIEWLMVNNCKNVTISS